MKLYIGASLKKYALFYTSCFWKGARYQHNIFFFDAQNVISKPHLKIWFIHVHLKLVRRMSYI